MKKNIEFVLVYALFQVHFAASLGLFRIKRSTASNDICQLPPLTGLCRALFRMYYYNATSNTCNTFAYGGCGGNENRFLEGEDCVRTCGGTIDSSGDYPAFYGDYDYSEEVDSCNQTMEYGNCDDVIVRYYFRAYKNDCRPFIWSGCGGNENNFKTKDECLSECVSSNQEAEMENQL